MKTDNELIAEFMGGSFEKRDIITVGGKRNGKWTFADNLWCYDDQLEYHVRWDWLMPVVEKIEKLFIEQIDQHNKTRPEEREADEAFSKVVCLNITAGLPYTYEKVVEFIKWYSQTPHP